MGVDADFSGYATKAGLKCSDGRIIMPDAFKHMDGQQVPLVWQHGHKDPANVLGHVRLEARDGHVYAYCYTNGTPSGQTAKALVQHGDVNALSVYANQLMEKVLRDTKQVFHGMIREVSLVLSGANPGALIDFVSMQHDDGSRTDFDDEAIIWTGETLLHVAEEEQESKLELAHADTTTLQDIYDSLDEDQLKLVHYMLATALEAGADNSAAQSDIDNEGDLAHKEGAETNMNVFEKNAGGGTVTETRERHVMSHSDVKELMTNYVRRGGSLKQHLEEYALAHGIEDIDLLFPDAKTVESSPQFDKRRTEWVAGVLNGTKHSPFSRIKSIVADITHDEARAKGYIKGNFKKEEWFRLSKRTTKPATVYKKQKLDRDDIIDITELDVVAWMKAEMRLMLEEEIAGAILIGDGRAVDDEDKIKDPIGATDGEGIRSILHEHELYAATVNVNLDDANSDYNEIVEQVMLARFLYKGSGTPTFYSTNYIITRMLLSKDSLGRRRWMNRAELASALDVAAVVEVEVMERETDLVGIIVNLMDYTVGTDRGGETNFFDFFDIDYNQLKYLYETRLSGALTKIRSALIIKKVAGTDVLVVPNAPTFVASTGVLTIVATTGVTYKNADTDATLATGAQAPIAAGATINVVAVPNSGYYFEHSEIGEWSFTRDAA